jgi:hypothetical protein
MGQRVCVRNSDQVGNTGTQPRMSGALFGGDSPAARTSSPRLSPRGARSAVGGIRTWVGKSGRRASVYDSTPIAALWAPGPNILQNWSVRWRKGSMVGAGPLSAATARISRAGPGGQHLPLADLTGRFVQGDRNAVYK